MTEAALHGCRTGLCLPPFDARICPCLRPQGRADRRHWIAATASGLLALAGRDAGAQTSRAPGPLTLYTFGDSVLDCAHYNDHGVHPGQLLVRNHDQLFPEFRGRDLQSRGPAQLEHRAVDGATVESLPAQLHGLRPQGPAIALVSVGGNDLLRGLARDTGAGVRRFESSVRSFLQALPIRPVVLATVYDPTFGDDSRNFLDVPAAVARGNHRRINEAIGTLALQHGRLADLHAHFLRGDPAWFTRTIEPSLIGASEIRRVFLPML